MKINTNLAKNYFACFDEARGFAVNKKRILKERKLVGFSYMEGKVFTLIIVMILSILLTLLHKTNLCYLSILIPYLFMFGLFYFLVGLCNTINIYNMRKKNKFTNTVSFDKNGITDESFYDIKMMIKWDKIKAILIGKYTVTILTDTPIYFYFNKDDKDKVLKALEKYNYQDLIIEEK